MHNQESRYFKQVSFALMLVLLTACGPGNEPVDSTTSDSLPSIAAAQAALPEEVNTADSIIVAAGTSHYSVPSASTTLTTQTAVPEEVDTADSPVVIASTDLQQVSEVVTPVSETSAPVIPEPIQPSETNSQNQSETIAPTSVEIVETVNSNTSPISTDTVSQENETPTPEIAAAEAEVVTPETVAPNKETTASTTTPVVASATLDNFTPNVIGSQVGDVVKILDNLSVSTAQLTTQQTSLNTRNGYVYTANIEPGPNGDVGGVDLRTVVRQGYQNDNLDWVWKSTLIEDRTIHDKWHTAPSIATDKDGYLHIVYNMHNFPWQHKIATEPNSIDSFSFHGQQVTKAELERLYYNNAVTFPTLGTAEIPGNMVTYPAFFSDNNDDLYLTYRFAARPKRSHTERTFSSGIAKFNTDTQSWTAIGGEIDVTSADRTLNSLAPDKPTAFAGQMGWTSYRPLLAFDSNNRMHVNWFWRQGTSGAQLNRPCYLIEDGNGQFRDVTGKAYSLPVQSTDCGNTSLSNNTNFYNIGYTAINSQDELYMLFSPDGADRILLHYDNTQKRWISEQSPYASTEIFFDAEDNLWAVSSGINIMRRNKGESNWTIVYSEGARTHCLPRVELNQDKSVAYIHTQKCTTSDSVTIYAVRLK